ncbi:hypothetical protein ACX16R_28295 [Bacillus cereus]
MKFTLFTISNEQIKEQLSKLQTKVESLETVKDVQDKIISAKDSQITFLQGEISSITTWVTWGAGLVITLASAAFIYIKFLERKAKKKIEEAEDTLQSATEQLAQIETARQQAEANLTGSNAKIEQVNSLIDKSNNIAIIAQEKIDELLEKQSELNDLASTLSINQKADITLKNIKIRLDFTEKAIKSLFFEINKTHQYSDAKESNEYYKQYNEFKKKISDLQGSYTKYSFVINLKIIKNEVITVDNLEDISTLESACKSLRQEINDYHELYLENN